MFRVREGPSPRLFRANVNGKNWGWARQAAHAMSLRSFFDNLDQGLLLLFIDWARGSPVMFFLQASCARML